MLTSEVYAKLETLVQEVAQREGCQLYDIEMGSAHGGRRTLRIFIDKQDGGPGIDDCSKISRGLSEVLDVDDPLPGGTYDLEVSTPGIERVLTKPWHFSRVVGKKIQVRLEKALEFYGIQNKKFSAMKQVREMLASADDEGIVFRLDEEVAKIPFSAIDQARVVFEMPTKGDKKVEKKKK